MKIQRFVREGTVLPGTGASSYRLKCCAKELEGYKGFRIYFGEKTEQDRLCWSIGGWQNQDTSVFETISGRNSELSQYQMNVERGREYELELCVDNRRVEPLSMESCSTISR